MHNNLIYHLVTLLLHLLLLFLATFLQLFFYIFQKAYKKRGRRKIRHILWFLIFPRPLSKITIYYELFFKSLYQVFFLWMILHKKVIVQLLFCIRNSGSLPIKNGPFYAIYLLHQFLFITALNHI